MTARFLVGDVRARMAELDDGSFDLILCSPPFLALRSYLPEDHPDKHLEIGSEATPAEFLDVILELTAEWGRLLAPHGSIAIELGDTYAGSGGGGGDYYEDGMRAGQPGFTGSAAASRTALREANARHWRDKKAQRDEGPLAKSLMGVPQLYQICITYGRNVLRSPLSARELLDTCEQWAADDLDLTVPSLLGTMRHWINQWETRSPCREYEPWRVRNLKAWIRSNPPVGALGDKERPATSYVIVATRATDRWFDLDAVRTPYAFPDHPQVGSASVGNYKKDGSEPQGRVRTEHPGGAPPRDWTHTVDLILDTELANRAGKTAGWSTGPTRTGKNTHDAPRGSNSGWSRLTGNTPEEQNVTTGAQGVHLRRALEHAGILEPQDFYDISPKGYSGAHYAVWPMELAQRLIDEMCPRHVCRVCGEPRRRLTETSYEAHGDASRQNAEHKARADYPGQQRQENAQGMTHGRATKNTTTVGWSDCGHNTWRPGRVLDPFVGSGTTLAVASGMARDAVGIDLDARNATLAYQRVGMFLTVDGDMAEPDLSPASPVELEPVVDVTDSL